MKTPDLKPCPFCGSKPTVDKCELQDGTVFYTVLCYNINCAVRPKADYCKDKSFIIKQWNRRVTDEND